ncbi:MAG TPA: DUF262 domain-containing protein [Pseudonocardiaceae bacterium]|jgi:hypothetical protein|nr:DUF262 domain-containing protein [Pseudonocardiaceae bacterium]
MQANVLTPQKLFEPQVRYIIPVFQRPYVWKIEKQWQPLWDDVRAVAEELTDGSAGGQEIAPHFLGAVVVEQQPSPAGYIGVRHVIDGQQRMITLQLLLNAARQVAKVHGRPRDAALLETLVRNPPHIVDSDDEILKVWPIQSDRAAFQSAMDDDINNDAADHLISQGITFLRDRIQAWALEGPGGAEPAERLKALALTLALHLKVVVIDLEHGDNAQAIFEALNDRGSPLLAADLIKNAVFQIAERQGLDADKLNQTYWAPLDDAYWRTELRQGRLNRPRIDIFLNYWLTMRRAHAVPSDHIFADFRDHILAGTSDVRPILDELSADSGVYRQLASRPPFSVEGTFYYRVIEVADIAATTPLLLWLSRPASGVPQPARQQALKAVESWVIRRMLCRVTLSDTNSVVVELLSHLRRIEPAAVGQATVSLLSDQTGESRRWPSDEAVINSLEQIRVYNVLIPRRRVRMLLEALEDSYRTPKTEDAHCQRGALTIEHVMPQNWRPYWPDGLGDDLDGSLRDERVQRLGNLTLLTSKLNPAVSNHPWLAGHDPLGEKVEGKRDALHAHSVLFLNKRLLDQQPDSWTDDAIEGRTTELAKQVTQIWQRL